MHSQESYRVPTHAEYDRGRAPSVTLTMTPEEALAVLQYLYKYDTSGDYPARYAVVRALQKAGVGEE